MLECPLYSLFEKVVVRNLKFFFFVFFQLDHEVEISLYLTKATTLRRSRELGNSILFM